MYGSGYGGYGYACVTPAAPCVPCVPWGYGCVGVSIITIAVLILIALGVIF
ncbi:MAG: hypothetical protein PHZ11_06325 [Desulfitobacteriaceae bacterium]|nr:hypothetical protein [Desulfitobacteriaceae bacterium]MDD4346499.1 hypothetical protein [Desulfitobacteriaceae bacterium]MDD4401842.1 hypothetical protein [Desulfitobacteriaceae bacterium]